MQVVTEKWSPSCSGRMNSMCDVLITQPRPRSMNACIDIFVATLHLIEPGREDVVEIPARMDVAVHVDVVRSNLHLRREF